MDKTSFNKHVGGEQWQPYIGELEVGLWLFSFTDDEISTRFTERKEHRHTIRVSSIARYLQDKLIRFPKKDNLLELESFKESLRQDARKLSAEPNGKKLLSYLGKIYVSEAQAFLNRFSIASMKNKLICYFKSALSVAKGLIYGYLTLNNKNNHNQEEVSNMVVTKTR